MHMKRASGQNSNEKYNLASLSCCRKMWSLKEKQINACHWIWFELIWLLSAVWIPRKNELSNDSTIHLNESNFAFHCSLILSFAIEWLCICMAIPSLSLEFETIAHSFDEISFQTQFPIVFFHNIFFVTFSKRNIFFSPFFLLFLSNRKKSSFFSRGSDERPMRRVVRRAACRSARSLARAAFSSNQSQKNVKLS